MTNQQIHTYCAMCTSRCGVVATVEDGHFTKVNADSEHPNGCICVKGTAAPEIVYAPERLQYPLRRTRPKGDAEPGWVRISWDEALDWIASRLLDIKARYGAEAVIFGQATPAGSSAADIAPWLCRLGNAFGSPNRMSTLHVCAWHRAMGSMYTYGVSLPAADYDHSRCILLWGHNPEATSPAAARCISQARARGAKLIVIDPRKHSLAQKADCWLRVRPGGDGILALSMIHVLIEESLYDKAFVRAWTNGAFLVRQDTHQLLTGQDLAPTGDPASWLVWDERRSRLAHYSPDSGYAASDIKPALQGTYAVTVVDGTTVDCQPAFACLKALVAPYAPERSEDITWVPARDVRQAVRLFTTEKPSCYCTWVGLEQHTDAMQTNRAVCIFSAFTGQFDAPGSNVLFAGTPTQDIMGGELLSKPQAVKRLGLRERPLGPAAMPGRVPAYEVYRAILTEQPYPVKGMVLFGSNPLLNSSDPVQGKAALEALDFYVHVDVVENPSALFADLLLPASTCWEHQGLMPSFQSVAPDAVTCVQLRPPVVESLYESRSDLEILFDLAKRLGLGAHFFDGDIDSALNYQLAPSGLTVQERFKELAHGRQGIVIQERTHPFPQETCTPQLRPDCLEQRATPLLGLIDHERQQHQCRKHHGHILLAGPIGVLKVIALVLQRMKRLMVDLPARTASLHEFVHIACADSQSRSTTLMFSNE